MERKKWGHPVHKELTPNPRSPSMWGTYYVVLSLIFTTRLQILLLSPSDYLENKIQRRKVICLRSHSESGLPAENYNSFL